MSHMSGRRALQSPHLQVALLSGGEHVSVQKLTSRLGKKTGMSGRQQVYSPMSHRDPHKKSFGNGTLDQADALPAK